MDVEIPTIQTNSLDKKLGKFSSRKLLVFMLSTLFFCIGMISAEYWVVIAVGYTAIQGMADVFLGRYGQKIGGGVDDLLD